MQITARASGAGDAACLEVLGAKAREELSASRGAPLYLSLEGVASKTEGPESLRAVVEIDETVVGFLEARLVRLDKGGTICRIEGLYVEPAAREVGAGEALLDEAVAWARRNGARGLDAYALPGARQTKNFYEAAGFVARLLVMHRPLDEA